MLPCSLLARPKVTLIVKVHAVSNGVKSAGGTELFHYRKQFVLALKATLPVVASIFGTIELGCGKHLDRNSLLVGERECVGKVGSSQAGRIGDHGEHVVAEGAMCHPRKVG